MAAFFWEGEGESININTSERRKSHVKCRGYRICFYSSTLARSNCWSYSRVTFRDSNLITLEATVAAARNVQQCSGTKINIKPESKSWLHSSIE